MLTGATPETQRAISGHWAPPVVEALAGGAARLHPVSAPHGGCVVPSGRVFL